MRCKKIIFYLDIPELAMLNCGAGLAQYVHMCNITQLTNIHTLFQDMITRRKVRDLFAKTLHLPHAITTICVYNAHAKSFV